MTAIVSVNLLHTLHHHHHRRLLFGLEMNRQVRTSALYILVEMIRRGGKEGSKQKKSRYCTSFKKNAPALTKRFGLTALHKQQIVTTVFGVVATLKESLLSFFSKAEN